MAIDIQKAPKIMVGKSKGFGSKGKEYWWWNECVQKKIKYKRVFQSITTKEQYGKLGEILIN